MNIPPTPWVLWPFLAEAHVLSSVVGGGIAAFIAILSIVTGVSEDDAHHSWGRSNVKVGYQLLLIALALFVLGFYLVGPVILAFLGYVVYTLLKSPFVLFRKEKSINEKTPSGWDDSEYGEGPD